MEMYERMGGLGRVNLTAEEDKASPASSGAFMADRRSVIPRKSPWGECICRRDRVAVHA